MTSDNDGASGWFPKPAGVSGVAGLEDPLALRNAVARPHLSRRDEQTQRASEPPPVSAVEYWCFLCAAAVITLAAFVPRKGASTRALSERAATGAFGTTRSSDEPRAVQHARAFEPGHGRQAEAPWQIPWRGWKDILWRTYQQIGEDRLLAVAAGVVFYGLLALFPAVTAFVSFYGLFAKAATINDHLAMAAGILPGSAVDIIREQVTRLTSKGDAKLGLGFVVGLGIALWSANAGMKAIMDALNVVYEEKEKRGFIKLNLVSFALTLAGIASMLLAMGAVVALPLLLTTLGLASITQTLFQLLRWPALLILVILGLAVIYRFAPSRREPRWQWISVGSIVAAIGWLASSALLSWYLSNFAHYDATYGSLGAGIGLMMWMWISSIVILLGAQLNSEIEHQTARDSTVEQDKPLGARGAVMADTVGEAA
jgi:membrane protein